MARRKVTNTTSVSRSTAAIFADKEYESDEAAPTEAKTDEISTTTPQPDEDDDPFDHPFPINYVYATQDFLNEELDFRKFAQVVLVLYILELFYLANTDIVKRYLDQIGVNFAGVLIEIVVSYNLQNKKFKAGIIQEAPKLPEFNTIYAILLPNLLFIQNDYKIVENLSYNYFVVSNLPVVAKCFSAITFMFMYDVEGVMEVIPKILVIIFFSYMIDFINTGNEEHVVTKEVESQDIDYSQVEVEDSHTIKTGFNASLSRTEIHLITVAFINLVFNLTNSNRGVSGLIVNDYQLTLVIFQKLLLGLIAGLLLSYPIFIFNRVAAIPVFVGSFCFLTIYQLTPIMNTNPVFYLLDLINKNQMHFGWWMATLLFNIALIFNVNLEFNFRRKIWHFVVVLTVLPSLIVSRDLTILALLGFIILLIITEVLRINKLTIIGQKIYDSFFKFQDFKDLKGPLNLSYIYLIIGILIPIVLEYNLKGQYNIKCYIGLISVGLGDAIASIIGKAFGRMKYFGGKKTVEGTLGFLFVNIVGYLALAKYLDFPKPSNELLFIVCFLGGVFEGVVTMNDNIFIPLIMYISWDVLELTI